MYINVKSIEGGVGRREGGRSFQIASQSIKHHLNFILFKIFTKKHAM